MKGILHNDSNLIEIKKSKFYAYSYYVDNTQDILKILDELHDKYPDATHITYAYVLDNPNREKAYDDGEPDGTAGKPILEVIKKRDLHNILVVVVRYFGGIKLGAGGLSRAYLNSAVSVLDCSGVGEYKLAYYYVKKVNIQDSKNYLRTLQSKGCIVTSIEYGQDVTIKYYSFDKKSDDYVETKLVVKEV